MFCNICGTELSKDEESLHYDCGGDCLLCMANAGDPECQERVKGFYIVDCILEMQDSVNTFATLIEEAGCSAHEFRMRIMEQFRCWG